MRIMSKNNNDNVLQVRVSAGDGVLHVQGKGEVTANREYGYAEKFSVHTKMTDWLAFRSATHNSFASNEKYYIRGVTLTKYANCVAFEIKDNDDIFVLHLNAGSFKCSELIDFALQNDLLKIVDDEYKEADE